MAKFLSMQKLKMIVLLLSGLLSAFVAYADNDKDQQPKNASALASQGYKFGSGDLIKVTVFNHEDLSGEYTINGAGLIALPLIGDVLAKDLTVKQVEEGITAKLKPDYLLNPRVSVQVLNYRPFYILGEVKEPKSYPYVDGMTYLNAAAIAGGFTYRAKEDHVLVIRANDAKKNEVKLSIDDKVQPGDQIHIEERFF